MGFEVAYLSGTFKGQFREFDGTLAVEGDEATLEGSVKVSSVDVKDENLSAHLQSPDFFDAEQYPAIRFTATDIALDGENVRVHGELTIKGVTQPSGHRPGHRAGHRSLRPRARRADAGTPSTAPRSASAGTSRCRAVSRRSPTTCRSSPSSTS